MAVYVDEAIGNWQGMRWAHLLADEEAELHRFAVALGIPRLVYQGPPKTAHPHYYITAFERRRAISLGAVVCSRDEIVLLLRRLKARRAA